MLSLTAVTSSSASTVATSLESVSPTRSTMNATNTATVGKRIYTFSASKLRFTIYYTTYSYIATQISSQFIIQLLL